MIQDEKLKTRVKVKVTELIAALVYLGHLYGLEAASKDSLERIILDQVNNHIERLDSDSAVDITDALSSNSRFERLINFSAEFNLDSTDEVDLENFAKPHSSSRIYL